MIWLWVDNRRLLGRAWKIYLLWCKIFMANNDDQKFPWSKNRCRLKMYQGIWLDKNNLWRNFWKVLEVYVGKTFNKVLNSGFWIWNNLTECTESPSARQAHKPKMTSLNAGTRNEGKLNKRKHVIYWNYWKQGLIKNSKLS